MSRDSRNLDYDGIPPPGTPPANTLLSQVSPRGVGQAPESVEERFLAAFHGKRVAWRTHQLSDAGFDDRAVRWLVEAGILLRVRQGCYVRRTYWTGLSEISRERTRIIMHAFGTLDVSRAGFVYSHTSAARLHGLFLWNVDTFIHLTQSSTPSSVGCPPDTKIHLRELDKEDIMILSQLRTTTLERTVIDCCLTLNYRQALI